MQDVIAIAVAVAAGVWLVRTLWRQLAAPACGKADAPAGADGFVSLDRLADTARPVRPGPPPAGS